MRGGGYVDSDLVRTCGEGLLLLLLLPLLLLLLLLLPLLLLPDGSRIRIMY